MTIGLAAANDISGKELLMTLTMAYDIGEEALDARADIWSFGVLLYEMLTGQLPFQGEQITATILAILNKLTTDLLALRPEAPAALVRLIERMLMKEQEERIGRMRQVAAELDRIR